ncbi:MAG: hypothetical protein EOM50_09800 [Erysipelotrichia bacterium]|nr:hypothetical protein [Erysipelotrichia bacterium]NCC54089.1 hypothetical protein [Erysipelotrichia bacterium]
MKKTLSIALTFLLLITMSSCGTQKRSADEFNDYTKDFTKLFFTGVSFDLNFLFDQPENYGINRDVYTLDFVSLEDYQKQNEKIEEKLEDLDEFDYDDLNKD